MKRWAIVLLALLVLLTVTGCSTVAARDKLHDYYVTGQFAGWGDAVGNDAFRMEPTTRSDKRVKKLRSALRGVRYLYVAEHIVISEAGADWTVDYVGDDQGDPVLLQADGNQSFRWMRATKEEQEVDLWLQSAASGMVKNLTPELLFIPDYAESTPLGPDWNDMCVVLKPGIYTAVLALMKDGTWAGGLIQETGVKQTTTTLSAETTVAVMDEAPVTSNTIPMATAKPDPTPTPAPEQTTKAE